MKIRSRSIFAAQGCWLFFFIFDLGEATLNAQSLPQLMGFHPLP